jgi:hypothetical protein
VASPATLRIEADLARLKDVRRFVRDVAPGLGADEAAVLDLVQAVDEWVTNVVVHGVRYALAGITDSRDPARRFYGEERLLELVGGACGRPAETIAEAIVADVTSFRGEAEPFDDLTLLVVERRPT